MSEYQLLSQPQADLDVEGAFLWYERQRPGLGNEFLIELAATYDRIRAGPFMYQALSSDIRRALLRRFPYAVFYSVETVSIVVLAVLHASRDPAEWQRRQG